MTQNLSVLINQHTCASYETSLQILDGDATFIEFQESPCTLQRIEGFPNFPMLPTTLQYESKFSKPIRPSCYSHLKTISHKESTKNLNIKWIAPYETLVPLLN
jgi:hypothetical protein